MVLLGGFFGVFFFACLVALELTKSKTDITTKVEAATALRDNLDHYTHISSLFTAFLKRLMPVFINILTGPCIFQADSLDQVGAAGFAFWG